MKRYNFLRAIAVAYIIQGIIILLAMLFTFSSSNTFQIIILGSCAFVSFALSQFIYLTVNKAADIQVMCQNSQIQTELMQLMAMKQGISDEAVKNVVKHNSLSEGGWSDFISH